MAFIPPVPSSLLTDILMSRHVGSFLNIFLIFQMLPEPTLWNFKHRTLSLAFYLKWWWLKSWPFSLEINVIYCCYNYTSSCSCWSRCKETLLLPLWFFSFHLGKYICSHDFRDKPVKKKIAHFSSTQYIVRSLLTKGWYKCLHHSNDAEFYI